MKDENQKKSILRIVAIVLAFVFVISLIFVAIDFWEKQQGVYSGENWIDADGTIEHEGREYVQREELNTYLIMGLDKAADASEADSYNNDRQADFMLLVVLNEADKTCSALHINRDTMTEINILGVAGDKVGTVTKQVALAHTYGNGKEVSCRNAANAVSKLLGGVSIDHYVSVTMDAVPVFTDLVNGVEVTVLDDFTGIDETLVKGETVTLRGEHALNYVRTRYGLADSSNEARMERQRQFLDALYQKTRLCKERDDGFVANAALEIAEYMVSDCSVNQLESLMNKVTSYEFQGIKTLEGESVAGEVYMEFYPDEALLKQTVIDLFYEAKK